MDKIQKIKQEIERIKKEVYNHNFAIDYSANGALDRVVRFIDSLPEKSGCEIDFTAKDEDLEEAAKHYLYGAILYDDVYVGNPTEEDCIRCFKAGAEWQRKKDQETIELAEDHAMLAGMMKEREEMMKDVVDATIFSELKSSDGSLFQAKSNRFRMNGVKIGDTIKVIPIKTEQQ